MSSIFGPDVLDIVSDIVDPAASMLHLTFILPCALFSNSSIFGQDVLDIVSDIVDPAASILHLTFYLALCIVQPDLIP